MKLLHYFKIFVLLFFTCEIQAKDLKASVAYIPLLAELSGKGAFIDLTKSIDNQYKQGHISIKVYPMSRSLNNIIDGHADFHLPMIRSPYVDEDTLPYRFVTEPMGTVCFVIYSHKENPIDVEAILNHTKNEIFTYKIETLLGMKQLLNLPFPMIEASDIKQSLKKVVKKRIDAFIFAQEESDFIILQLNMKAIHRSLFACWDDVIVIPKGNKGERTDQIISEALRELSNSGTLKVIRERIHVPYVDWQP